MPPKAYDNILRCLVVVCNWKKFSLMSETSKETRECSASVSLMSWCGLDKFFFFFFQAANLGLMFCHFPVWLQDELRMCVCVSRWNCTDMSVQTTCCRSAPEFVRCWRGRSPPACLDSRACWGPAGRISSAPQRVSGYVAHDVATSLYTHSETTVLHLSACVCRLM